MPQFKALSKNVYENELINVDFTRKGKAAMDIINTWVNQKTMGKISKILDDVPSPNTMMILLSALYFNGEWNQHFLTGFTKRYILFIKKFIKYIYLKSFQYLFNNYLLMFNNCYDYKIAMYQYCTINCLIRTLFYVEPNESILVDMMYNAGTFPFYEDKQLGVKILGLPYKGHEVSIL